MKKGDILRMLADTLDFDLTRKRCQGISNEDIQSILREAAILLDEYESESSHKEFKLYVDGASRGNPGHAGVGVVLKGEDDAVILKKQEYIGTATNNVAEYTALIFALEACRQRGIKRIKIFSDSQLMVRQLRGEYKVREPHLKELYRKVLELLNFFDWYDIIDIPREHNAEADRLANRAIDMNAC